MRIEPLGDAAYLLRELPDFPPYVWARHIEGLAIPGVIEATPAFDTVGVFIDPLAFDPDSLSDRLVGLPEAVQDTAGGRLHTIPTCYESGEDLGEVSERLGITRDEVVAAHTSLAYTCFAIGFCPGFPYLGYLPDVLRGVPRRATPRVRVEPGSVAITGDQTGVYSLPRPGGWSVIGRTPLTLVSVEEGYFPIAAGDRVRFAAISREEFAARRGERL